MSESEAAEKPGANPVDSEPPKGEDPAPKALSAEEQMALYEESLKEDDWGHQPC